MLAFRGQAVVAAMIFLLFLHFLLNYEISPASRVPNGKVLHTKTVEITSTTNPDCICNNTNTSSDCSSNNDGNTLHQFNAAQMKWEEDAKRLQSFFFQSQYLFSNGSKQSENMECPMNRTYVMINHDYGHFSSVHVIAHSFLKAKVFGQVFVPTYFRHSTISKNRCPSQALYKGCMFEPIVGCQVKPGEPPAVNSKSGNVYFDHLDPRYTNKTKGPPDIIGRLKELSGVQGDYGVGFYHSQAVKFVSRPNQDLQAHMDRIRVETIGNHTPLSRVMGVQMRLFADKLGRFKELKADHFARAVVQLEMVHGKFDKIWVATNGGPTAVNRFKTVIQQHAQKGENEADRVVASPGKFWAANDLTQEQLADTAGVLHHLLNHQNQTDWDEGLSLQAEITLISHCGYSVGNLQSNVGRYMWEVQATISRSAQPNFFDIYGSPYFSGWVASRFPHHALKTPGTP